MRTLTLPALAFSIIWQLGGTADTGARLSGTTTSDGGRLPGVKVTAEGLHVRRTVVSDEQGAFDVGELPLGAYSVTTGIPGFRSQTKRVTLAEPGNRSLDFTLALGLLQIVDYIVPDAATAYRKADAVAHIRIERTVAPIACVDTFEAHPSGHRPVAGQRRRSAERVVHSGALGLVFPRWPSGRSSRCTQERRGVHRISSGERRLVL